MPRKGGQAGFWKRTHKQRKVRAKRKERNKRKRAEREESKWPK